MDPVTKVNSSSSKDTTDTNEKQLSARTSLSHQASSNWSDDTSTSTAAKELILPDQRLKNDKILKLKREFNAPS
jgi:hypothetical protein